MNRSYVITIFLFVITCYAPQSFAQDALYIDLSGNVGIGMDTVKPEFKLTLGGSGRTLGVDFDAAQYQQGIYSTGG